MLTLTHDHSQAQQWCTKPALAFQPRNPGTGRPHMQCSAYGSYDHFRKDYHQDNFCTRCRSKSHATHMCRAPIRNNICICCGSTQHSLGNCTSQPNDNREEPRLAPWDLHSQAPYYRTDTKYSGLSQGNQGNSTNPRQTYKIASLSYGDYRYEHDRARHQQTRFDERYNRQYSPNYNYQPSPVSVAGPDLSATLIDLANIQSRSLDLTVANQKSQQDIYNELTRVNRDKANDACLLQSRHDDSDRGLFEEWIDKLAQACRISGHDFRTKIIKKSI